MVSRLGTLSLAGTTSAQPVAGVIADTKRMTVTPAASKPGSRAGSDLDSGVRPNDEEE